MKYEFEFIRENNDICFVYDFNSNEPLDIDDDSEMAVEVENTFNEWLNCQDWINDLKTYEIDEGIEFNAVGSQYDGIYGYRLE